MSLLRAALALGGLGLTALIVFAIQNGNFSEAGAWLLSDPWGLTTMADLYLGFVLSAVLIALYERSLAAVFWIIPLPVLGNVWTVVWFVYRLPDLAIKLRKTA